MVSALQHLREWWLQRNRNCKYLTKTGICKLNKKGCRKKTCSLEAEKNAHK
jgi:hypothetical protein